MKFGEHKHIIKKRKEVGFSPNDKHKQKFKYKGKGKHKGRKKHRHKTRKERLKYDTSANHPAHKANSREISKFKSDDLSVEGMEKFIKEFITGKTIHYHRADHIPKNNHKLIVKHLNTHNIDAFLHEAKIDKKMAVIWTCVKGANNYPKFYKQIKHLAKHIKIKKYFKFGKIDPFKNDEPKILKGNKHADKLFIYLNESDVNKWWKQKKYEDMANMFKYLIALIGQSKKLKIVEEDL